MTDSEYNDDLKQHDKFDKALGRLHKQMLNLPAISASDIRESIAGRLEIFLRAIEDTIRALRSG